MKKIIIILGFSISLFSIVTAQANVKVTAAGLPEDFGGKQVTCNIGDVFPDNAIARDACLPNDYHGTDNYCTPVTGGSRVVMHALFIYDGVHGDTWKEYGKRDIYYYLCTQEPTTSWNHWGSISTVATNEPLTYPTTTHSLTTDQAPTPSCPDTRGNPCSVATGEKIQAELDIAASPGGTLSFTRYYASQRFDGDFSAMGKNWRHTYSRSMDVDDGNTTSGPTSSSYSTAESACSSGWGELKSTSYRGLASSATATYQNGLCQLTLNGAVISKMTVRSSAVATGPTSSGVIHTITRPDGSAYVFEQNGSGWRERYGAPVTLEAVANGWRFTDTNGTQEIYNAAGHLISITDRAGHTQTLSYDTAGHLTTVQDDNNRQLTFSYDGSGHIVSVTDPSGGIHRYAYDSNNRLVSVSYPDNTPNDGSSDPTRRFLYEDSRFPNNLTGIIDEKGQRFASWTYDDKGRATSSQHAGGAERVEFTYNADGSTTVRDANGGTQTYQFSLINGSLKVTRVIHQ